MASSLRFVNLSGEMRILHPDAAPIASGADGAIHLVRGETDLVLKLYHEPEKDSGRLKKLQAMMASPPDLPIIDQAGRSYVQIAWPKGWLTDGAGRFLGFAMPRIDLSHATSLEHLLSRKTRVTFGLTESYGARIAAAANLASLVAELHAHGHHIIDLKPINLTFYTDTFLIAVLDCDGFSVNGTGGGRFAAHQYSDGYICPAALQQQLPPQALGEDQDRFALAVIIFQLLNQGLHPYQGIPAKGGNVPPTTNERVHRELYAYGRTPNPDLAPSPWSIHEFLDVEIRRLFDRAFTSRYDRPSAREWRDHLLPYADRKSGMLTVCRNDRSHVHFGPRCPWCALDNRQGGSLSQQTVRAPTTRARGTNRNIPLTLTLHQAHYDIIVHTHLNLTRAEVAQIKRWVAHRLPRTTSGNSGKFHVNVTQKGGKKHRIKIQWRTPPTASGQPTTQPTVPTLPAGVVQTATPSQPAVGHGPSFAPLLLLGMIIFLIALLALIVSSLHSVSTPPAASSTLLKEASKVLDTSRTDTVPAVPMRSEWEMFIDAVRQGDVDAVGGLLGKVDVNRKDSYGRTPLYFAADSRGSDQDSAAIAMLLISSGAEIDAINSDGRSPLYIAISREKSKTVEALLMAKADPSLADKHGWTPLILAVYVGNKELVKTLLSAGADLHAAGNDGWTALHYTANKHWKYPSREYSDIAKLLIDAGADVNALNNDHFTPLHLAVLNNKFKTVTELLAAGADPNIPDEQGDTPLMKVLDAGNKDMAKALREAGAEVNTDEKDSGSVLSKSIVDPNGWTDLMYAVYLGEVEKVTALLEAHVDVNMANDKGWTALHLAAGNANAQQDHADIVQLLIAAGANINARTEEGDTALNIAVMHQKRRTFDVLLAAGANPSLPGTDGYTPLMYAAYAGNLIMVDALIAAQADINLVQKDGWSALHLTAWRKSKLQQVYVDVALSLLAAGADPDLPNGDGWTPLMYAISGGYDDMVKAIISGGADLNRIDSEGWTPLHMTMNSGGRDDYVTAARLLLANGADINRRGKYGLTPLGLSVINQAHDTFSALLKLKADPDLPDEDGSTPLMYAVARGDAGMVTALLAAGADAARTDNTGQTALHSAARKSTTPGLDDIIKMVVSKGADVNATDNLGFTPLMLAAEKGNIAATSALIRFGANILLQNTIDNSRTARDYALQGGHKEIVDML